MTSDPRWQSIVARDKESDSKFFYSVKSTGGYCRPSFGASRARPEDVQFFPTTEGAEKAGFRACKRRKPAETDGIFGPESAETTQPKTTKEQEPMTTVVALHEPGDEREDWRRRLHSLQEFICELLIRNQELRMSLLDSGRLVNECDEFVREHRSQSPVLIWNSSASRSCAGSRVQDLSGITQVQIRAVEMARERKMAS